MESVLDQVAADAIASALAQAALLAQDTLEVDKPKALESISLRQTRYVYAQKRMYRVYDKLGHFVLIEADSAHEAYAKSGIAKPIKIQRESFFTQIAIAQDLMESTVDRVEIDIALPTQPDKKSTMDMQQIDADIAARKPTFEALSFRDVAKQKAVQVQPPSFAPIAVPQLAEQAESLMEALPQPAAPITPPAPIPAPEEVILPQLEVQAEQVMAAPEAPLEEAAPRELTIEEVNALMNAAEGDEA